jgi:ATP-dependent helicase/nuclease subunit A
VEAKIQRLEKAGEEQKGEMSFTENQLAAITNQGNTLVEAGAGAGKTRTLVERCIEHLRHAREAGALKRMLVVTFTEAAAAEARQRIRTAIEANSAAEPGNLVWEQELALIDSAHIQTLHSFCFALVRENFFDLELDPAVSIMDEQQSAMLFSETLEDLLDEHYAGKHPNSEEVKDFIWRKFRGWDMPLREIIKEIHEFTQTRPQPEKWFREQIANFEAEDCAHWRQWHQDFTRSWCAWWLPFLKDLPAENTNAHVCAELIANALESGSIRLSELATRDHIECWPSGKKTKHREAFGKFFEELFFLVSLEPNEQCQDPLGDDWRYVRGCTLVLLKLARDFSERFTKAKRAAGMVDFHDLEQYTLKLLVDETGGGPTALAVEWRERFEQILVDEYQDINRAQDLIIRCLSRPGAEGNAFLVGDVKQSIYRFRQADPAIFQSYAEKNGDWKIISLQENFRSGETILNFINPLFGWLMRKDLGGVEYDQSAELKFGDREGRKEMRAAGSPGVELHLLIKGQANMEEQETSEGENGDSGEDEEKSAGGLALAELANAEKEARLVAFRLKQIKDSGMEIFAQKEGKARPARWSDMVVLMRAASTKSETYAKAFDALGIPLHLKRSWFFESAEALDLCSLLHLLDNPSQDIPLVAVLRSPLAGLSANDLARIRSGSTQKPFWRAVGEFYEKKSGCAAWKKLDVFLPRYHRWRNSKTTSSIAQKLETILADTQYLEWVSAQPRGSQRAENIQHLLRIARRFEESRGESLYLFLRYLEEAQNAAGDSEPPAGSAEDAVRLMTIHQSKGLEFPIVAVPDLGKAINFGESKKAVLLDETHGICVKAQPKDKSYPTLPLWICRREERMKSLAEEMRVLYVALTRAENLLLLFGSASGKQVKGRWAELGESKPWPQRFVQTASMLDWIGSYLSWKEPGWAGEAVELAEAEEGAAKTATQGVAAGLSYTIHLEHPAEKQIESEQDSSGPRIEAEKLRKLRRELAFQYPHEAAVRESAKTTVTALRRKN